MNLPQEYLSNMQKLLGENYNKYIDAMQKPPVSALRVNPLKSHSKVCDAFGVVKKIDYADNGYIIPSGKIGKHPYHIAGAVYVQEPSSMIPVIASGLNAELSKDLKILDLCASPGGKSGQIAEILAGDGVLVSNEIDKKRARVLQGNIERMGYTNVIITCASPQELSRDLANQFDYIFVDAPCGGEGMFRKDPETIAEWKQERLLSNQKRQKEILIEADKMLKTGGKLIYSTCTFAPEEDEDVALWFASTFGYKLLDVPQTIAKATTYLSNEHCRRFYPFLSDGEGQFVCVMQKQSEQKYSQIRPYRLFDIGRTERQILADFTSNNFEFNTEPKFTKIGQNYCIINQKLAEILPFLQKLPVINAGVTVGTIEKNRLVPHNNIFSSFGNHAKNKLNFSLGSKDLAKYLHGEVIANANNFSGYVCIMADGLAIGGAKATGGELKNLFPKGLRI